MKIMKCIINFRNFLGGQFKFFFFFDDEGEGHPETVYPIVIKTMTEDTDHELQGSNSRGA